MNVKVNLIQNKIIKIYLKVNFLAREKGWLKMKKILLCCAAGMSTSLLVNKMKAEAEKRGIETKIWAEPLDKAKEEFKKADVVLLGPQVKYALSEAKKIAEENNINIDVINMVDYGMMNGAKVLDQALNLLK